MNIIKRCKYGLMAFNHKDIWQGRSFQVYGEYSESEVDIFRQIIKPEDVVMEVGANIGSFTVVFARLVGPKGLVVAFEPERNCYYTLCGNVAINNLRNVFCYQQALGNQIGTINVPELDYERTVNWGGLELDHDYTGCNHYPVTINKLDAITATRCDFIKIDVEGMELDVIEGGIETINKFRPILYVENDRKPKEAALLAKLRELNYIIYSHIAPFFNPDNFGGFKDNVFGQVSSLNVLCIPQEKSSIGNFGLSEVPV